MLSGRLASLTILLRLRLWLWFNWIGSERSRKDIRSGCVLLRIQVLGFKVVEILSNVGGFPIKPLKNVIKECDDERADERANPVDPMVTGERVIDDSRTECSCRVDTSTGKFDTFRRN